jgi:anaerobic selenocysteine-containing dehydrogenase
MKATLGYGASTCSYVDWLHADLIVLFGSNVANDQPVTTKYLHHARQNGAQIAVAFRVSTRRGKQFNSMIQREVDPLTGAARDDILISAEDLRRVGLADGARVELRSPHGAFAGRLRSAAMRPGHLEVHWPEGNTLLSPTAIDPDSMEPDYNATVTLISAAGPESAAV